MRFLRPDMARFVLAVPLIIACWFACLAYVRWARRSVASRFLFLSRRSTLARDLRLLALAVVAAGAVVLALMRPQVMLTREIPEFRREDLIVMLDRSVSMQAHDIEPSRLSRATLEIRNLVENKPEALDRIGLVGFADASLVLSYLTGDTNGVLFYLDWIDEDRSPLFGTNIGGALMSGRDIAVKDAQPSQKVFLLISDGEDYGSELDQALGRFRAESRRVHCIGVGSDAEMPIPLLGRDRRETLLRDDSGRLVKTRFKEAALRRIAALTGGRYVRSRTGRELSAAVTDIVRGERRVTGWRTTREYRDVSVASLGVAGLAAAALCIVL